MTQERQAVIDAREDFSMSPWGRAHSVLVTRPDNHPRESFIRLSSKGGDQYIASSGYCIHDARHPERRASHAPLRVAPPRSCPRGAACGTLGATCISTSGWRPGTATNGAASTARHLQMAEAMAALAEALGSQAQREGATVHEKQRALCRIFRELTPG